MKRLFILIILVSGVQILSGQSLYVTFTGSGTATAVDSVKATNLRTNESVSLPGNDTLFLMFNTGISTLQDADQQGAVYPNPCMGKATFVAGFRTAQTITLEVYNLTGQVLARSKTSVQPGRQAFNLTFAKAGIYMISLKSDLGISGIKVICTETTESVNRILPAGIVQGDVSAALLKEIKIHTLGYKGGDIILYRCRSGIYTTIVADSPTASTRYTVEFALCQDPDGKNYSIVKVGTQTWMAENLAWLPGVCPSAQGSDSLKQYYVYGFEDSLVGPAKNTANYHSYGVLYNWPAAMNTTGIKSGTNQQTQGACPQGWHLPGDDDWKILEKGLGMSQSDADTVYLRSSGEVGNKLKASWMWYSNGNGSNSTGFTALPGGYRNTHGSFLNLISYALFWTATNDDTLIFYRSFSSNDEGVYRMKTLKSHGISIRCIKD